MDPNHWNTYNLQYAGSSGSLGPSPSSLNRLELHSGLTLGHTLQATHSSLSGRGMAAIPGVNYGGLGVGVPLLDPVSSLATSISGQPSHKALSLAQSQLMFEPPQVRVSQDQIPSHVSRYEGSSSSSLGGGGKSSRPEALSPRDAAMARSQILEAAAAARVWGSTNANFSSYNNQFGSLMSEVPVPFTPLVSSPSSGNSQTSLKSAESALHSNPPPPAHSSGIPRSSTVQRITPHPSELSYIPSSLAHVGTLYSQAIEKDTLSSMSQSSSSLHRQTPVHIQHGYPSSREDIEDLSASAQNSLYGSYANLSAQDAQNFSVGHMSADINYEAVSPAPPLNSETHQSHPENASFPIGFSEFVHLTPDHPQNLSDKFQESDFRLKMDSTLHVGEDPLSFSQVSQERHDLSNSGGKMSKNLPSYVMHRPASVLQQSNPPNQPLDLPQSIQSASDSSIIHPSALLHSASSLMSPASLHQQNQAKPPIQAMAADSTTKPKRRSRKKKDAIVPVETGLDPKKSIISQDTLNSIHRHQQQIPQHSSSLLSMTPTSHVSTLSHPSLISQNSQIQQQQQQAGYVVSGGTSGQYSSRDNSHRAQTPSMPQNFSSQEHQGYMSAPSPKVSPPANQSLMRQTEFTVPPSRITNEKARSYKKKSKPTSAISDTNVNQNNSHLYSPNMVESPMNMQTYPGSNDALMSPGGPRDSPMQDIRGGQHITRLPSSFTPTPDQPQHSGGMTSQLSRLSQQLAQGSIPMDSPTSYAAHTKLTNNGSNHYMTSPTVMNSIQHTGTDNANLSKTHSLPSHSPLEPSAINMESTPMSHHGFVDSGRNPSAADGHHQHQQDSGQFQMEFGGQPFLEQLAGVGAPMAVTSFSQSVNESGDAVYTTLGAPSISTPLQQHLSQQGSGETYKQGYEESVHQDVRPVGTLTGNLSMGGDVSFTPFFDNQSGLCGPETPSAQIQSQPSRAPSVPPEPEPMTLTFVPEVSDDDEFSHFSEEPSVEVKQFSVRVKSESFQESFLSYLQGNKQETLSSVSSAAITKRPLLPKYVPEPRRPRPPPAPTPAAPSAPKDSSIVISDDEKLGNFDGNAEVNANSLKDESGYSVKRKSELVFKITLPKGGAKNLFNESALLSHNRKMKDGHSKGKKRKGKYREDEEDDNFPGETEEGDLSSASKASRKSLPQPMRASIGRKAKDKVIEKSKKRKANGDSGSSTEEESKPNFPVSKMFNSDDSDQDYDSDKDPVWMPFAVDLKSGHDSDEKRKKIRRPRIRLPPVKSVRPPAAQNPAVRDKPSVSVPVVMSSAAAQLEAADKGQESNMVSLRTGQYLIEKKDLQNYEGYPIWRLEDGGSMIHKFELVAQGNMVKHKAVGTYSTWMKSMQSQFLPIKIKELSLKGRDAILVQVLEEFRPKPPNDGKLILQYEDDPLVEQFNVYLQVFISQALEPSFLKTIIDRKEEFYVESLEAIDRIIDSKLEILAKQAQWTVSFKDALHKFPLMKEIDRPNLKQACQACENSSPPTIKSVVFSGHAYDRTFLMDKLSAFPDAQEFMIGKVAASYVRSYHTLYHFKYWLHRRCHSKVRLMKESSKAENLTDEAVLDRCLENRNWVLQLFDDLKKLLTFGGDAPR